MGLRDALRRNKNKEASTISEQQGNVAKNLDSKLTTDKPKEKGRFGRWREKRKQVKVKSTDEAVLGESIDNLISSLLKDLSNKNIRSAKRIAEKLNKELGYMKSTNKQIADMLDNTLMTELQEFKKKYPEVLKKEGKDFVKRLSNASRTVYFLKEFEGAGFVSRKELDEFTAVFTRLSFFIKDHFNDLKNRKYDEDFVKKLIKDGVEGLEKADGVDLQSIFDKGLSNFNDEAVKLFNSLKNSKNDADTPIYQKLMHFIQGIMMIYDFLDEGFNPVKDKLGLNISKLDDLNDNFWGKKNDWCVDRWNKSKSIVSKQGEKLQSFIEALQKFNGLLKNFYVVTNAFGNKILVGALQKFAGFSESNEDKKLIIDGINDIKSKLGFEISIGFTNVDLSGNLDVGEEQKTEQETVKSLSVFEEFLAEFKLKSDTFKNKFNDLISLLEKINSEDANVRSKIIKTYDELVDLNLKLVIDTSKVERVSESYLKQVSNLFRKYGDFSGNLSGFKNMIISELNKTKDFFNQIKKVNNFLDKELDSMNKLVDKADDSIKNNKIRKLVNKTNFNNLGRMGAT